MRHGDVADCGECQMGATLHQSEKSSAKPGISRTGCLSGSGFQPTWIKYQQEDHVNIWVSRLDDWHLYS